MTTIPVWEGPSALFITGRLRTTQRRRDDSSLGRIPGLPVLIYFGDSGRLTSWKLAPHLSRTILLSEHQESQSWASCHGTAPHPRGLLPADRRCHGEHGLRAFLEEAEIRPDAIDTAILRLRTATEYELLDVFLTPERLTQLGLRWADEHGQRVGLSAVSAPCGPSRKASASRRRAHRPSPRRASEASTSRAATALGWRVVWAGAARLGHFQKVRAEAAPDKRRSRRRAVVDQPSSGLCASFSLM